MNRRIQWASGSILFSNFPREERSSVEMESRMEALLTAIVLWLSINFPLPANLNHPSIKFVSAAKMAQTIALTNNKQLQRTDASASEVSSDIVSLYNNASKTIYLREMDGRARHLLSYLSLCMKWSTICKTSGN